MTGITKYSILILFLLAWISIPVSGQAELDTIIDGVRYYKKRSYTATRTEAVPKIDGSLDDDCWSQGNWSGGYTQWSPDEGAPPSQSTELKILYDYNNVYVGFKCYDTEPERMHVRFNSRDVYSGDMIGIAFDSYYDKKTAYEFSLTSAGQKMDVKHTGDNLWDLNWNAVWDGATALEDSGWTAEMTIPLSQVRYINKPDQVWGLHSWRRISRINEISKWQLHARNAPSMIDQIGSLHGISDIRPSRQVELSPYASIRYVPENSATGIPGIAYKPVEYGAGLDAKIGVSSNLVMDVTINPDFGQVEADPSELNLTSYETFFDEKRPFFLEGRDLFDLSIAKSQLFYSRRIGQAPRYHPGLGVNESIDTPDRTTILGATKLTGKTSKGLSVGIMESLTARETATIGSEDTSYNKTVNPFTNYFVGSVKKEYNDAKTIIGGMFTSGNSIINDSYIEEQLYRNSFSGGLDFIHYTSNKVFALEGKTIFSSINGSEDAMTGLQQNNVHRFQRPGTIHLNLDEDMRSLTGTGGEFKLAKQGGKWRGNVTASWLSPNLELNDMGYLRQADMINEEAGVSYVITEPKGILRSYSIILNQNASWTFGKERIGSRTSAACSTSFVNLWSFRGDIMRVFSESDPRILRGGPALATNPYWAFTGRLGTSQAKELSLTINYDKRINESGLYDYQGVLASVLWLPAGRIRFNGILSHEIIDEKQQYILNRNPGTETVYLFGDLDQRILNFTLRAQVFINPEMSLEYYGSPYLSIGDYSGFKKVSDHGSRDYSERFYTYTEADIQFYRQENVYYVTAPDQGGFSFVNPDFNYAQFRSNLVFRWEYKLGSVFFFVWSHEKTHDEKVSSMDQGRNFSDLLDSPPGNVFMIKFNYWFTL